MTELDRRTLLERTRGRDGPTVADRARLRARLEPTWTAYRAERASAGSSERSATAAARTTRGQYWVNAALLAALVLWTPDSAPASGTRSERIGADVSASRTGSREAIAAVESAGRVDDSDRAARGSEAPGSAVSDAGEAASATVVPLSAAEPARARAPSGARKRAAERAAPGTGTTALQSSTGDALDRTGSRVSAASTPLGAQPARSAPQRARSPQPSGARDRTTESAAPGSPGPQPSAVGERRTRADSPAVRDPSPSLRDPDFTPQPIEEELTWLAAAQQALDRHRPNAALRLVQEHAFRYPRGALAPERIAVQALALCALHRRSAAREVLNDLARVAPGSPLLQRVQRKCGP